MMIILRIFGKKRSMKKSPLKKYCCSFYVDEGYLSLYHLFLMPVDIYLIYRLAHLVPVYTEQNLELDEVWKKNGRLKSYLPNHPLKQAIFL
jgi:hypothetical protein